MDLKTYRRRDYDVEIDESDRLKQIDKNYEKNSNFTPKAGKIKIEFDYEEDPYEPEKKGKKQC